MSLFFLSAILLSSIVIIIQDFRERKVSVWALALFTILTVADSLYHENRMDVIWSIGLNLCFLLIQFAIVYLYLRLRNEALSFSNALGAADIWLLCALAAAFSVSNFILFTILSLFLTLVCFLVYRLFINRQAKLIPLAGFIGVFYCTGRLILYFYNPPAQWNDELILSILRY